MNHSPTDCSVSLSQVSAWMLSPSRNKEQGSEDPTATLLLTDLLYTIETICLISVASCAIKDRKKLNTVRPI